MTRVFSWQETRLVSKSLTVHYKRVLYVLDPTDAARAARGKRVKRLLPVSARPHSGGG